MTVFDHDDDRRRYLLFLSEETVCFGVKILARRLMPNHVCCIATPKNETAAAMEKPAGISGFARMTPLFACVPYPQLCRF
jgi:hypothetical protein